MTFENMNTDDFFPLLQQTLSDTFKIDSYLMHAPYQNFEKMDMGLRRMVWGNYKTNSPLFSLFGSSPYQIIVLQSSLGFYNVIVSLTTDAEPDILGIMPFLAEPINQVTINRLIRDNHIDPKYNSVLLHFYYSLPVVDIDELTLMLQHFISFFIPAFKTCSIEYVNYKTESHNTSPNEERFQKFSSDYIAELISRLEHCCQAMTAGNTAQAIDFMKKTLDYSASFQSLPAKEIRSRIASLNFFLASRMFGTAGILYENDCDYPIAKALAADIVTEKMFEPIGKETLDKACKRIDEADYVIDTGCPIGSINSAMKELLDYAEKKNKRILTKPDIDTMKSLF